MATDKAVRASIQKLMEGVQIIGFDWTYLYLNETAERHARRQAHELIGRRMMECYPGIDRTPMFEALQRVMRGRKAEQFINDFVYPDGSQGWFELLIEPVPDGVCVLSLDISDKQRSQAQQRQAQKMEAVGRLAGGIAHDFSNVLTAMLGFCDLVLARAGDDQELTADLLEIRKAGERAERLTRQLLAFSRKQVLIPQVIDLNHVVLDLHAMLTRLIGDHIRLLIETAHDLRHTRADPGQIEQILMNLVVNARDAMPHGGTVRISTINATLDDAFVLTHPGSVAGNYVALSVEDTGNGIPADILAHVFEPFFTTKGPGSGTGLGLPTVYGIVKQSGGYVAVDTKIGVGTTITTYFPVVNEPLSEPAPRIVPRTRQRKRDGADRGRRRECARTDAQGPRSSRLLDSRSARRLGCADDCAQPPGPDRPPAHRHRHAGHERAAAGAAHRHDAPEGPGALRLGISAGVDHRLQHGRVSACRSFRSRSCPDALLASVREALDGR